MPDKKDSTQRKKKPNAKKKHPLNRPEIIVTSCLFGLLFAVLIGYLGYFTATSEQEMLNNSYNSRQAILLSRNYRGTIYSADGDVLAQTALDGHQGRPGCTLTQICSPTSWDTPRKAAPA